MIECLKEHKKQLSMQCHQKIFKLQETEMMDPELDYQLMRVCKQMIKVSVYGSLFSHLDHISGIDFVLCFIESVKSGKSVLGAGGAF